jgi:hypothetical protein
MKCVSFKDNKNDDDDVLFLIKSTIMKNQLKSKTHSKYKSAHSSRRYCR